MADTTGRKGLLDPRVYAANRSKVNPEDLLPYAEQWVAWSRDGSQIVDHHIELAVLVQQLEQAGIDREDVVFDHIPPGGVVETQL
jgi:hypothetical protein